MWVHVVLENCRYTIHTSLISSSPKQNSSNDEHVDVQDKAEAISLKSMGTKQAWRRQSQRGQAFHSITIPPFCSVFREIRNWVQVQLALRWSQVCLPIVSLLDSWNLTSISSVMVPEQGQHFLTKWITEREKIRGWSNVTAKGYYLPWWAKSVLDISRVLSHCQMSFALFMLFLSGKKIHLVFTLFQDIAPWVPDPSWDLKQGPFFLCVLLLCVFLLCVVFCCCFFPFR